MSDSSSSSKIMDRKLGVKIFWDFENLWFPKGYDHSKAAHLITMALKTHNRDFYILDKIIGYGVIKHTNKKTIQDLEGSQLFDIFDVPTRTAVCEICKQLNRVSKNCANDDQYDRKTDLADILLVEDIFLHAIDENVPCNILVISSDSDFVETIKDLQSNGVTMMAAVGSEANYALRSSTKIVWDWENLINGLGKRART